MHFDDKFIGRLPDDYREAINYVCTYYRQRKNEIQNPKDKYEFSLEAYAFLNSLIVARGQPSIEVKITGNIDSDRKNIDGFINDLVKKMQEKIQLDTLDEYKRHYAMKFGLIFHYEFSEGDLKKMQGLLNELRDLISESQELAGDHRNRLLKKLERLQSELHKKVSDLDRFWGFFIDASIVVGLMGENAKPMVEVIQKIVKIIWPTQTRAYELPSDFPFKLLGQAEDEKS